MARKAAEAPAEQPAQDAPETDGQKPPATEPAPEKVDDAKSPAEPEPEPAPEKVDDAKSPAEPEPEPAPEKVDDAKSPAEPEPEPVLEGDVTVIVAIPISGLRDGQPWPAVDEPITLPAAEAAGYLQFGYVREAD